MNQRAAVRRRNMHGLTDGDRLVLQLLEIPPIREWPRAVLATEARMNDRAMRQCVERLRLAGFPVLSSSTKGGGYRLAQTASEVGEFREHELASRMRVIAHVDQAMAAVQRLMTDREREGAPVRRVALL